MRRHPFVVLSFATLALLPACGREDPPKAAGPGPVKPAEGENHDHGERRELGKVDLGGHLVTVALFGAVEAGDEAVFDVEVADGRDVIVRAWVGVESGSGSLKAKFDGEDGVFHGHAEVPKTLPKGSALWFELEAADGKRSATSLPIP